MEFDAAVAKFYHDRMMEAQKSGTAPRLRDRIIFGAAALWSAEKEETAEAFDLLRRYGVNRIDTSVSYRNADKRIGELTAGSRDSWFLAGKIDSRDREEAREELRRSLGNLGTGRLDLLQMHELVSVGDVERFLSKEGTAGVLLEAKRLGLAGRIGVTAHGPAAPFILAKCLEALPLDSVLLPWNYLLSRGERYAEGFSALAALCRERGTAVWTMKSIARSGWGDAFRNRTTWYRPLEEPADIDRAVWWLMGQEELSICSPGDLSLLPLFLDSAARFTAAPADAEMEEMRERLDMRIPEEHDWPRMNQSEA